MYWHDSFPKRQRGPSVDVVLVAVIVLTIVIVVASVLWAK